MIAKDPSDDTNVSRQPIRTEQDSGLAGTPSDTLNPPSDQTCVSVLRDCAAQPQTGADHHGHRHPDDAALMFDTDLISLDMIQLAWSFDQLLMHALTMACGTLLPRGHRAFIKRKGGDNGLRWATMREQGDDDGDQICRLAQAVEWRPPGLSKGLTTFTADKAVFFQAMDTDVAFAALSSGRTLRVGAKCCLGVHWDNPRLCFFGEKKEKDSFWTL